MTRIAARARSGSCRGLRTPARTKPIVLFMSSGWPASSRATSVSTSAATSAWSRKKKSPNQHRSRTSCLVGADSHGRTSRWYVAGTYFNREGARQQDAVRPVLAGWARGQEVVGPRAAVWDQLPQRDLRAVHLIARGQAAQRTPIRGPMTRRRQKLAAVGEAQVDHQVTRRHRHAADLDHRRRHPLAVGRCGPDEHPRLDVGDADVTGRRRDQCGRGQADRARRHAAGRPRSNGDHAVDPNRAVDKHDRRVRPLGLGPVFERVAAVGLGERENPKPLERPIDRDLLRLIEVARGQIFVSDDGGIQLPVRADLWVERVSVRLLAAKPCDGVEIRVAEDRYADSVHDLELELVDRERTAHDDPAASGGAAGDGEKRDRGRELASHLPLTKHAGRGLNVTKCGTKPPGRAYSLRMVGGGSNL